MKARSHSRAASWLRSWRSPPSRGGSSGRPWAVWPIVAGVIGALMALKVVADKGNAVADAKASAGPEHFAAAGIDPRKVLDTVFKVTLEIGVWLCIAGGVSAILGGLMLLMKQSSAMPAMAGMPGGAVPPPMTDSGFGTSVCGGLDGHGPCDSAAADGRADDDPIDDDPIDDDPTVDDPTDDDPTDDDPTDDDPTDDDTPGVSSACRPPSSRDRPHVRRHRRRPTSSSDRSDVRSIELRMTREAIGSSISPRAFAPSRSMSESTVSCTSSFRTRRPASR